MRALVPQGHVFAARMNGFTFVFSSHTQHTHTYTHTLTRSHTHTSFSAGWKIGWVVGPSTILHGIIVVNQWVMFSVSTPTQQAIAWSLQQADAPYEG